MAAAAAVAEPPEDDWFDDVEMPNQPTEVWKRYGVPLPSGAWSKYNKSDAPPRLSNLIADAPKMRFDLRYPILDPLQEPWYQHAFAMGGRFHAGSECCLVKGPTFSAGFYVGLLPRVGRLVAAERTAAGQWVCGSEKDLEGVTWFTLRPKSKTDVKVWVNPILAADGWCVRVADTQDFHMGRLDEDAKEATPRTAAVNDTVSLTYGDDPKRPLVWHRTTVNTSVVCYLSYASENPSPRDTLLMIKA